MLKTMLHDNDNFSAASFRCSSANGVLPYRSLHRNKTHPGFPTGKPCFMEDLQENTLPNLVPNCKTLPNPPSGEPCIGTSQHLHRYGRRENHIWKEIA